MEYIIGIVMTALIVLMLITGILKGPARAFAAPPEKRITRDIAAALPSPSPAVKTRSLSKEEIAQRLKKLANSPPPKNLSMGAMCYDMAGPPERTDYVCPECGEKTIYSKEGKDRRASTNFIQYDLPDCRRMAKDIKGVTVELDEHEFCKKCSPKVKEPELIVKVRYAGRADAAVTRGITRDDLKLINEFASGSDRHSGAQGRETPLSQYITRLQELLGIPSEGKNR